MPEFSTLREQVLKREAQKCEEAYGMLARAKSAHNQRGTEMKVAQIVGQMDQAQAAMQDAQRALALFYRQQGDREGEDG